MAQEQNDIPERPLMRIFWVCVTCVALSLMAVGCALYLAVLDTRQTDQHRLRATALQEQNILAERLALQARVTVATPSAEGIAELSATLLAFDLGRERLEAQFNQTSGTDQTAEATKALTGALAALSADAANLVEHPHPSNLANNRIATRGAEVATALKQIRERLEQAAAERQALFQRITTFVLALALILLVFEAVFGLRPNFSLLTLHLAAGASRSQSPDEDGKLSNPDPRSSDETETLRHALANSETARQETAEMSYMVAHDLKSPLNTALLLLQEIDIELQNEDTAEALDLLASVKDTVTRMGGLIDDTLSFSWASNAACNVTEVDMQACLQAVLTDLQADIRLARAEIDLGPLDHVIGDPTQLRLLVQNLLSNAVKFQPPGQIPRITVSCTSVRPGGPSILQVQDNGIGISEGQHTAIFKPFKRVHLHEAYPGSGLGLATCKQIAQNHAGEIHVTSNLGKGTRFDVVLNATVPAAPTGESQLAA